MQMHAVYLYSEESITFRFLFVIVLLVDKFVCVNKRSLSLSCEISSLSLISPLTCDTSRNLRDRSALSPSFRFNLMGVIETEDHFI